MKYLPREDTQIRRIYDLVMSVPGKTWTSPEVSKALGISPHVASSQLRTLYNQGLLRRRKLGTAFLKYSGKTDAPLQTKREAFQYKIPQEGTLSRKVYDLFNETPGIEITTGEVAAELEIPSRKASAFIHLLVSQGFLQKDTSVYPPIYWIGEKS